MLEAILKEIKVSSSTWQALILAGLLPAIVLSGGWWVWHDGGHTFGSGLTGAGSFIGGFKDSHDFLVREGVPTGLVLLISVLFYLLRSLIQYLLKRPPRSEEHTSELQSLR